MRFLILAAVLAASSPAPADSPPPPMLVSLVRGTVERVDAAVLVIKSDAGAEIAAAITPKTNFATVEARTFNQIKPTDFVGITAVPGRNGHLRAEEIHIIPVAGLGEGQYPWDHHPSSSRVSSADMGSMTNGSVAALTRPVAGSMTNGTVETSAGASELTVTFHGAEMVDGKCEGHAAPSKPVCTGTSLVDVTPTTVITAIVKGTSADAKAGLAVFAAVASDDHGHAFLASATLEKNGVKPEF